MTPEQRREIAARYDWQPGEREAMERDMAERAEREDRIARDKWLAWYNQRNEQRRESERAAEQQSEQERKPERARPNMPSNDELWNAWVDGKIRAALRGAETPLLGAIADVMAEQRKANLAALDQLRRENDSMRTELDELARRVNQLDDPVVVRDVIFAGTDAAQQTEIFPVAPVSDNVSAPDNA